MTPDHNSFDREALHIYDTTLRDGAQQEGLNLSVHDKLTIARHLDDLGVGFIEGGWPGANPKDTEFFALAKKELKVKMFVAKKYNNYNNHIHKLIFHLYIKLIQEDI